jgi:PKD repeat protein
VTRLTGSREVKVIILLTLLVTGILAPFISLQSFTPIVEAQEENTPQIIFDKEVYTPFDEMIVGIIAPGYDRIPYIAETIYANVESTSESIDIQNFNETGSNTGIFEKHITLTPDKVRFPADLKAIRGDNVTIWFFDDRYGLVTKPVPVRYNIGQIMFDADIKLNASSVLQVVDPDASMNPNTQDVVQVRLWSTTDRAGLVLTLAETADRTGIFEGDVIFSPEDTSAGNRLVANECDTVTATYADNTLPDPAPLDADNVFTEVREISINMLIGEATYCSPRIDVQLDKERYISGDTVHVKGSVFPVRHEEVELTVLNPGNESYVVMHTFPNADGTYSFEFKLGAQLRAETYIVRVKYIDTFNEEPFGLIPVEPLTVEIMADGTAYRSSPIKFDAVVSGGLPPYTYSWDFGDETVSSERSPVKQYSSLGSFTVQFTVTDSSQTKDSDSKEINVINRKPIPSVTGPDAAAREGELVQFSGSSSNDPDDDAMKFVWNFGDGTSAEMENPTHTFADDGTYYVTLTVIDEHGGGDVTTHMVVVSNVPPEVSISSKTEIVEGEPVTFTSTVEDQGTSDTHTYTWYFGDGSTDSSSAPTHTYYSRGPYTVTLIVADSDNATDRTQLTINVKPRNSITAFIEDHPWVPPAAIVPPATFVGLRYVPRPLPRLNVRNPGSFNISIEVRFEMERDS